MEEENEIIHRIEAFLNGKEDDHLMDDIKSKINSNDAVRQDLLEHVQAYILLKKEGEQELKDALAKQLSEIQKEDLSKKTNSKAWGKPILILVLFFILAFLATIFLPGKKSEIKQFAFQDPALPNLRAINEGEQIKIWNDAMHYFGDKDYQKTLLKLEPLESDPSFMLKHKDYYNLIVGVCALRLMEYNKALEALSLIPKDSPYYDQAIWYQLLCAYKKKNPEETKLILQKIEAYNNHYRAEEAKSLFESMLE